MNLLVMSAYFTKPPLMLFKCGIACGAQKKCGLHEFPSCQRGNFC